MPIPRPSLAEQIDEVRADFGARLPGADVRTRRSPLDVFARTIGFAKHVLLGWLAWVSRQMLPDTADADWLQRHGDIHGVARRQAAYATGAIVVSGLAETFVPAGSVWRRGDGVQYVQDEDVEIGPGGSVEIVVTAAVAGAAGNAAAAAPVTIQSAVSGVQSAAVVGPLGIGAGADRESDDDLRARVLDEIRRPPHGGNANDYRQWALSVPGVTRAWVFPIANGEGTVVVRFMMDDTYADGIPQPEDVSAVDAVIQDARPVTAHVSVWAPIPIELIFDIRVSPDTLSVRQAIEAELRDLIRRECEPGATLLLSHVREAISLAGGEVDHTLLSPADNVTLAAHQITTFGGVIWG